MAKATARAWGCILANAEDAYAKVPPFVDHRPAAIKTRRAYLAEKSCMIHTRIEQIKENPSQQAMIKPRHVEILSP
jgi:hypothetical protein